MTAGGGGRGGVKRVHGSCSHAFMVHGKVEYSLQLITYSSTDRHRVELTKEFVTDRHRVELTRELCDGQTSR